MNPGALADRLPIDDQLEAIRGALTPGATVVLQAPPGAGKTTRVPLELLKAFGDKGRILLIEPRRLATRAAAERLAAGLGEAVGEQVGYSVRLERRSSSRTRLEVLTGGLFLRRLQADPALEGVTCVIFDEFHERGAEADLALALVRQARSLLRPELRLLVMSATMDLAPLAAGLDGATVITSPGRSFSVAVEYQRPRERERLEQQVVRALECHWLEERGPGETVLLFLPGQREIGDTQRAIEATAWGREMACTPLHGQLSLADQGQAIGPAPTAAGKVVLATSIAESSLTIAGVTLVIDAGQSRRNRFDPATGLDRLVTLPASLASAEQRRGRAGRLGPGRCLRLWAPGEEQRRPGFDPPELLVCDPLPIVLQLAEWGDALGEDLPWIDPPPRTALQEARELLEQLGALDGGGRITPAGRTMAGLGLSPRLAHLLLRAQACGSLDLGCELAVLLSERDPLNPRDAGSDLLRRLDWLRARAGEPADRLAPGRSSQRRELQKLQGELKRQVLASSRPNGAMDARPPSSKPRPSTPAGSPKPTAAEGRSAASEEVMAARLLGWAYPERIALSRGRGDGRFLMRGGRGAVLHPDDPLADAEGLAIAIADGEGAEARVRLAVRLERADLEELAAAEGQEALEARWDPQAERVRCERSLRLGALVLARTPWPEARGEEVQAAMAEGLRQLGLAALPWCPRSRSLQQRLGLAHRWLGPPWPDRRLECLEDDPAAWLGERLAGLHSRQDLRQLDLIDALWGELDWAERQQLERWFPETLAVPSGRRVALDYGGEEPVLAVKLQEMFGAAMSPTLLDGRLPVTVQLLSPAGRPAALTRDLAGFWSSGYAEVRRELRGRYPKHPWPEDPRQAVATALTKAGLERKISNGRPPGSA
ncbi:MAG: helicase-related protein [Cyanobacteria bacterium]|nr:helicase-related protein [Cyanobacteriota bacterium]